jgi:putative transposase
VLDSPRDRQGRFDPVLIGKYQRHFPGFDEKIIALYARGMSTCDIQAHVGELYGIEIFPDLVSAVTDSVIEEVTAWQNRPLESIYAIVYFDAFTAFMKRPPRARRLGREGCACRSERR